MLLLETSGQCQTSSLSEDVAQTSDRPSRQETGRLFKINGSRFLSAYEDVINILQAQNSCSDFFGSSAVEVFNELATQLTITRIPQNIGIRMSGRYRLMAKHGSSFRYRLFDKAEINIRGAFYIASGFISEPRIRPIGPFLPDTREVRAIMLLHELGHLIETPSGQWLLPDDGKDDAESQKNTRNIAKHCQQVIRAQTRSPQPRIQLSSGN